jgi:hypothetical protein
MRCSEASEILPDFGFVVRMKPYPKKFLHSKPFKARLDKTSDGFRIRIYLAGYNSLRDCDCEPHEVSFSLLPQPPTQFRGFVNGGGQFLQHGLQFHLHLLFRIRFAFGAASCASLSDILLQNRDLRPQIFRALARVGRFGPGASTGGE